MRWRWPAGLWTLAAVLSGAGALGCAPRPAAHQQPPGAGDLTSARDRAALAAVAASRAARPAEGGYRLGPDDLLDIRIPDLLDAPGTARAAQGGATVPSVAEAPVFQQGVRVAASGDVTLPLIGAVRAQGLTAPELQAEIARRLVAARILRAPQVSVLVAEYRSHVVAVVGSVERPGLYPLTRPRATIADIIWAAGGPNKDAGRLVEFSPADDTTPATERVPLRLDLRSLLGTTGQGGSLDVQVRPGDVISVAPAGSVLVDGWVDRPGSYPITRGLTVSGAVAAAGGQLFAADRRHVSVKRVGGTERSFTVDLEAISTGRAADVPITDGDVIHLPASAARLVPYAAWTLVREMIHVGGSVALF
jgi:polysaccharide export outer membrane protein